MRERADVPMSERRALRLLVLVAYSGGAYFSSLIKLLENKWRPSPSGLESALIPVFGELCGNVNTPSKKPCRLLNDRHTRVQRESVDRKQRVYRATRGPGESPEGGMRVCADVRVSETCFEIAHAAAVRRGAL